MTLKLTPEERELLTEILEERHRELQNEIFRTDHREFKQVLKGKEKLLADLLERLAAEKAAA
jgi:DNA-binding MarR family transcriptional regulator